MQNLLSPGERKILLIDDDESEHLWVNKQLRENAPDFRLIWKDNLKDGREQLHQGGTDLVLLDLHLPDSGGIETFKQLHSYAKKVPIIVLSGSSDEDSGLEAVRKGAHDYLVKGDVNGKALVRVIRYALNRHDYRMELRNSKLTDELTGMHNRQGFMLMAEHQIKAAKRENRGFFISCVVLDNFKTIHARHGEGESNLAVTTAAKILEESCRTSDLIARVGADMFVIITAETNPDTPHIFKHRLQKSQTYYNAQFNLYKLSLSVCTAPVHQANINSVVDLSLKIDKIFSHYRSLTPPTST